MKDGFAIIVVVAVGLALAGALMIWATASLDADASDRGAIYD